MNSKTKALLSEELMVAGPIAGVCLLIGLAGLLNLRYLAGALSGAGAWAANKNYILTVSVAAPLLSMVLLVLNVGNSGQVRGGFSRRILRLPVETWRAVLAALCVRVFMVLCVAGFVVLFCRVFYGNGPGARMVLLFAALYLFVQVADWTRGIAAVPVAGLAVAGFFLLFMGAGGMKAAFAFLCAGEGITPRMLAGFAVGLLLAYAVSLRAVSWDRRGGCFSIRALLGLDGLPGRGRQKAFASPVAAQAWFIRRRGVYPFFAALFLGWCFLVAVRWIVVAYLAETPGTFSDFWAPYWLFEILPFAAFLGAAAVWNFRMAAMDRGRPGGSGTGLPVEAAQAMQAHLAAAFSVLLPTFLVLAAVSMASFLLEGQGQFWRLLGEARHRGELGAHEMVGILLRWSLLAGMAACHLSGISAAPGTRRTSTGRSRLGRVVLALMLLGLFSWVNVGKNAHAIPRILEAGLLSAPVLLYGAWGLRLWNMRRQGILSNRVLLFVLLLWAGFSVAFYPHALPASSGKYAWVIALSTSAGLSALLIPLYLLFVWTFGVQAGFRKIVLHALLAVLLIALLWLRWPQTPAWVTAWRAQGLPTNLEEINASYPPVAPAENLADRYLQAGRDLEDLKTEVDTDKLPIVGDFVLERGAPIPPDVYQAMTRYNEAASSVRAALHDAAHSGLSRSHYPVRMVSVEEDVSNPLSHLSRLRELVRLLGLESTVAAVAGKPGEAAQALLDIFPIADSLKDEPILISQLVRYAIYGMALSDLERIMNLAVLPDADLKAFLDRLQHALRPMEKARETDRGVRAEEIRLLSGTTGLGLPFEIRGSSTGVWMAAMTPLLELASAGDLNRLLLHHEVERITNHAKRVALNKRIDREKFLRRHRHGMRDELMLTLIMAPAFERAYDPEWRLRTRIGTARAAIAAELFRHAHGTLPQRLEELVPEYLDEVPPDLYCGKSVHYHIRENGGFVVYSCDQDGMDNGGKEHYADDNKGPFDMTFTVRPPEIQARAQVKP